MSDLIKVLVVDDSAYSRKTIGEILESTGMCRVVGMARDGEEGIKKALELKPDLITLDLEMPKMDGFTFLRILMKTMPTPVLVVSSMAHRKMVFRAMEMGAIDFLAKPDVSISTDIYDIKEDLINKMKVVGELQMLNIQRRIKRAPEEAVEPSQKTKVVKEEPKEGVYSCLVIGSSTGGPSALQEVLSTLPGDLPVSVAVSQHMPAGFTKAFAERLNKYSEWYIKEAEDNEVMEVGKVLLAPGGYHMMLTNVNGKTEARFKKKDSGDKYVPSVDMLFESAAEIYGKRLMAVVLTGMGNDGKMGAIRIKKDGGTVLAESQETAIVYGMPREVREAGAVDKLVALDVMSKEIARFLRRKINNNAAAVKETGQPKEKST